MSDTPPVGATARDAGHETVLLTGISGFIAKRIAADLLNAGHTVRGTLRSAARAEEVRDAIRPALTDPTTLARLSFAEADLTSDAGWPDAMEGVSVLLHTASPFPLAQPKNAEAVIRPAVDGTLRALRAALAAGVTRVVLTSSVAAVQHADRPAGHVFSEDDWTDPTHPTATPYAQSKTLAERAAWDFAAAHPQMRLTAINPGLVAGRPLDRNYGTSLRVIERLLSGKDPAVPDFCIPVVDVADVSVMHLAALRRPETAGRRYIAADRYVTLPELAGWLAETFPGRGIPTRTAPTWLLRVVALWDPAVRSILPVIGEEKTVSHARARDEMGIAFTPTQEAVLASAAFLDAARSADRAA